MTTQILSAPAEPEHVVRAAGSAEFLSMVPHLAGFVPRDSIVLVPFAGRRTNGAMRVDLPAPALDADDLAAEAATLIGLFARVEGTDRIAIVVYTDDPFRDEGGRIARVALVEAVRRCAEAAEYELVDALCVAADGWGSYIEPDGPYAARPLEEIRAEDLDWPGEPPLADQSAGCELPPSDLAERERVAREIAGMSVHVGDLTMPQTFEDVVTLDGELSPHGLGFLVLALDRPAIRDIALSQWCGDLAEGYAAQRTNVAWAAGDVHGFDGPLRLAGEGDRPDPARLGRALELAKRAASVAPQAHRAGPLAAAAWLSWALGRSTHAAHFVGLAREIVPDHGLANLIAAMIAHGHLPSWIYERGLSPTPPVNRAERRAKRRGR